MIRVAGLGWVSWQGYGMGPVAQCEKADKKRIPAISWSTMFDEPDRQLSRMDVYSRIGLASAVLATRDAHLENHDLMTKGIVVITQNGCLQSDEAYFKTVRHGCGVTASPTLFAYTLPSSLIGEIAIRLGITGPGFVIQEENLNGHAAIEMALDILESNEADVMLVGHCDIGAPDILHQAPVPKLPALFIVLQKGNSLGQGYGVLSVSPGGISFNDHPISGHLDIAALCASYPSRTILNT